MVLDAGLVFSQNASYHRVKVVLVNCQSIPSRKESLFTTRIEVGAYSILILGRT